jgi:hypothetical protein
MPGRAGRAAASINDLLRLLPVKNRQRPLLPCKITRAKWHCGRRPINRQAWGAASRRRSAVAKALRIIILDACRNNPFKASMRQTEALRGRLDRGLAVPPETKPGTLVVYSAKEGEVAIEGDGVTSSFALAFVAEIKNPGREVQRMFDDVRDDVLEATNNRQQPYKYGSLLLWPLGEPGDDLDFALLGLPQDGGAEAVDNRLQWSALEGSGQIEVSAIGYPNAAIDRARQRRDIKGIPGWVQLEDRRRSLAEGHGTFVIQMKDEDAPNIEWTRRRLCPVSCSLVRSVSTARPKQR